MAQTTTAPDRTYLAPVGGVQNSATRVVATALGIFAGLLAIEHGYFEIRQGNVRPRGIVIRAIGPPCQPKTAWHGCEPAMTVIPNFRRTGIAAMLTGVVMTLWSTIFAQRKHGGLVRIALSAGSLLVGGGFTTAGIGALAGAAGTRIHAPLTWWQAHLPARSRRFLARLWPWSLIALALESSEWVLGYFFNRFMLKLSPILTVTTPGLLLLIFLTGLAHDLQKRAGVWQAHATSGQPA